MPETRIRPLMQSTERKKYAAAEASRFVPALPKYTIGISKPRPPSSRKHLIPQAISTTAATCRHLHTRQSPGASVVPPDYVRHQIAAEVRCAGDGPTRASARQPRPIQKCATGSPCHVPQRRRTRKIVCQTRAGAPSRLKSAIATMFQSRKRCPHATNSNQLWHYRVRRPYQPGTPIRIDPGPRGHRVADGAVQDRTWSGLQDDLARRTNRSGPDFGA
jgi:hypothetical protein